MGRRGILPSSGGGNSTNDWHCWESECRVVNCERSGRAFSLTIGISMNAWTSIWRAPLMLGVSHFRLEWSRIEVPPRGSFPREALAHYRRMLQAAKDRLKVMLTLHHFTLPLWVADYGQGGWKDPRIPDLFAAHSRRVVAVRRSRRLLITVNEPQRKHAFGFCCRHDAAGVAGSCTGAAGDGEF